MIKIQENIKLASFTTFKIGGPARFFCIVTNEEDLVEAVKFAKEKKLAVFVLGGGSNILIADHGFLGLVIKMEIKGINVLNAQGRPEHEVILSAGAGENWDNFVEYTVKNNLFGIENLSAIPGTVGAAPVQNIGAYGCDVSDSIVSVRVFDTSTMKFVDLSNSNCELEYRDSVFKHKKGIYIISRVDFKLIKNGNVNISYKDLQVYFDRYEMSNKNNHIDNVEKKWLPSLKEVREAIIKIRTTKLPDWKYWGTAGSYFKNPIISKDKFETLLKSYPELPGFEEPDGQIKLSLGWILDKVCNVKGLVIGNVGTHDKQALVLVSKPGATAEEVMIFARELMERVKEKTGIEIEGEVEWVN